MRQDDQPPAEPPQPPPGTSRTRRTDDVRPPRQTLLAVVGDEGGYRSVLDRGQALADRAAAPLHVAVLHERLAPTTDPALADYVGRRLHRRLRLLGTELAPPHRAPQSVPVTVLELDSSLRQCRRLTAWRAVDAYAGAVGASLIVISWELSEVAWSRAEEGSRVLVAVPDEDDQPLDPLAQAW